MRIRLEGRLEEIERATEACNRALASLPLKAPFDLTPVRAELETLASRERELDQAVAALRRLAGPGSASAPWLAPLEAASSAVNERLGRLLGEAGVRVETGLALRARAALDFFRPAGECLYSCRVRSAGPGWMLAIAIMGVTAVSLMVSKTGFPLAVTALGVASLVGAGALVWSANRYRLELFADRVRLTSHARTWEARLDARTFEVAEKGALRLPLVGTVVAASQEEAQHLLTLAKLLATVDWKATAPPPADALLLPARWTATRATGALIVCEGESYFLHPGRLAWDLVARIQKDWPLPTAPQLGWVLLRLPREERQSIFMRLEEGECLERLGPAPEVHFEPLRARLAGTVEVPVDRKVSSQILEWEARVADARISQLERVHREGQDRR